MTEVRGGVKVSNESNQNIHKLLVFCGPHLTQKLLYTDDKSWVGHWKSNFWLF